MARKQKSRAKKAQQTESVESRTAEVATVAWTMCTLTTLLCLLGALTAGVIVWMGGQSRGIELLGRFLLVSACVTGLIGIGMLPMVQKLRRDPVPRQVILIGVSISTIPIVVLAVILASS